MTEPIEDPEQARHAADSATGTRMASTRARIALGAAAVVAVAAISVVLTLVVSDTGGGPTYDQAEVDAQLAAARSALPSASPGAPGDPGAEQIVVTDQGTFVGRCVSGQPLLSRWTLNAGYRLPDPSILNDPSRMAAIVIRPVDPQKSPPPSPPAERLKLRGWEFFRYPSGWLTAGLVVQGSQDELLWESFTCQEGKFVSEPVDPRHAVKWRYLVPDPEPTTKPSPSPTS